MRVAFLACGVLRLELEQVLQQIRTEGLFDCEITATYLQAGLHIDFDRLKEAILFALKSTAADRIILLYGSKCHPEFHEFLNERHPTTFPQSNCIELILGERMQEIDRLSKTFYLTPGWLLCWREFFEQGMQWDEVDMRQSFISPRPTLPMKKNGQVATLINPHQLRVILFNLAVPQCLPASMKHAQHTHYFHE